MEKIIITWGKTPVCKGSEVVAIAKVNGEMITYHLSSSESYLRRDMTSEPKRLLYERNCPDGYELVWKESKEGEFET